MLPVLLCFLLLVFASWFDLRTGFVPDRLWLLALIGGCASFFLRWLTYEGIEILLTTLFSCFVAILISLALFRIGVFGGADAKALIFLSLYVPTILPLSGLSKGVLLTPISATINLVMFLSLIFVLNFLENLLFSFLRKKNIPFSNYERGRNLVLLCAYRRTRFGKDPDNKSISAPKWLIIVSSVPVTDSFKRRASALKSHGLTVPDDLDIMIWYPLRIPVTAVLALSLFCSIVTGDLLSLRLTGIPP